MSKSTFRWVSKRQVFDFDLTLLFMSRVENSFLTDFASISDDTVSKSTGTFLTGLILSTFTIYRKTIPSDVFNASIHELSTSIFSLASPAPSKQPSDTGSHRNPGSAKSLARVLSMQNKQLLELRTVRRGAARRGGRLVDPSQDARVATKPVRLQHLRDGCSKLHSVPVLAALPALPETTPTGRYKTRFCNILASYFCSAR